MSLFNTGVRPIVDQHLLDEAAKVRDYGEYWSASSGGFCMRKNIFERLKVPHSTPDDPRKQRVFSSGHIFHSWIQELTRAAGISVAQELELQDEDLMIRGHFDDLVLIRNHAGGHDPLDAGVDMRTIHPKGNGHLILYDYKTVNSRSFSYAKANGNKMSHFHRLQLGSYLHMLRAKDFKFTGTTKFELGKNTLVESRILKISKDDLRMEEQELVWTPDLDKDVVGYWSTLNGYWRDKKLPRCTCADYEGGFMAKEKFNPFFYQDEPCSIAWYELQKKEGKVK